MERKIHILLFLSLFFLFAGCNNQKELEVFDPMHLYTLEKLYGINAFRTLKTANKEKDSVIKLILFDQNYHQLPKEICTFRYLNSLELSRNSLTDLPACISKLM